MAENTQSEYTYYAFISYKREDEKWARWLQKKLESYGFPVALRKDNPTLPSKIRPVFRDQSDLSGGNLRSAIEDGLRGSKYLIVVCSPRAAQSPWVSKEVQFFIDNGKESNIIPFIIGGSPNAKNPEEECFPEGLRQLSGEKEILGININEMGRDAAAIKVIARMFDLRFDTLWQRHERAKRRMLIGWGIIAAIVIAVITGVAILINSQNLALESKNKELDSKNLELESKNSELKQANDTILAERDRANEQTKIAEKERNNALKANQDLKESNRRLAEERDNVLRTNWMLMTSQSRSAAGKANDLLEKGDPLMAKRLMMNYLPDAETGFNWPYVPEVEQMYRKSLAQINSAEWHQNTSLDHKLDINTAVFNQSGDKIITASNDNTACLWNIETGDTLILQHNRLVNCAAFNSDGTLVATGCRDKIARLWDTKSGQLLSSWEPKGNIWEIMFTNDGEYVLTYSSNRALTFYSVKDNIISGKIPYEQRLYSDIIDKKRDAFIYNLGDSICTLVDIKSLTNSFESLEHIYEKYDWEEYKKIIERLHPKDITPVVLPANRNIKDIKYNSELETFCVLYSDSVAVYADFNKGSIIDIIPNVLDCSISRDGSTLALAKDDGKVLLVEMKEGQYYYDDNRIKTDAAIVQIKYSDDDLYLIGTGANNTVYLWSTDDDYNEQARLLHRFPVKNSSMNYDGSNILTITMDNRVNLWGHSVGYNKSSLALENSYADAVIFNDEETYFFVASYDGHISCYEIGSGKQIWRTPTFSNGYKNLNNTCIGINSEGSLVAVGNDNGEIIVVNAADGKIVNRYQVHDKVVNSIFFIDDKKVITASHDGKAIISDITDEGYKQTYLHDNRVIFATKIKGKQQILSATANGLYLWQLNSDKKYFSSIINDNIESVAYNPITNKVAIGTSNNSIYIKSLDEINGCETFFQHGQSPKGELFYVDSYNVIEHDSNLLNNMQGEMEAYHLGSSLYDILSHKDKVDGLQFSIDGNYLLSKSRGSIKIWDVATGVCISDDVRYGIGFRCCAMSPRKTYIATSSMDVKNEIPNKKNRIIDYLFLWKFNSLDESLKKEKQKFHNWKLTPEERRKYYLE